MADQRHQERGEGLGDEESSGFDSQEWEKRFVDDPEYATRVFRAIEGLVPDILKRTLVTGIGSTLLNEDGLRSLLAEKKLPKEAFSFLMSQASGMRREILRVVSREIRIFLENMDFGGEISKILTTVSFEIKTEIRFIPNDAAVKPSIRNRVKVKRADEGAEEEGTEEAAGEAPASGAAPASAASSAPPAAEVKGRKLRWGLRPRAQDREDGSEG
jgi:hypothetical protein